MAARPGRNTLLLVDGLGHGLHASDAAQEALRSFSEHAEDPLGSILRNINDALRTTRGAVAAVAEIDWNARELRYAGVGNIAGKLLPVEGKGASMISHPGTLGQNVGQDNLHFQEFSHAWPDKGHLILHSDGLSSKWTLDPYPGLSQKDPSIIAGVLYRDFASRHDDIVVLAGRERARTRKPAGRRQA